MLTMEEAQMLLTQKVEEIIQTEKVSLFDALGRKLAEDIIAVRDQPPFPRSPLDGYALRGEDTTGASHDTPVTLKVIGKVYAGSVYEGTVKKGEAVRLMTGAPIPDGADTVIRQEDTDLGGDTVSVYRELRPYQNYCYQGEDYQAGSILVKKGRTLHAGIITVIASLGKTEVEVFKRPRIALLSTGDEVLPPEAEWKPGKIYDANRAYIGSRLMELQNPPVFSEHISDEGSVVAEEIRRIAPVTDLIITTGGVSVGEKDIMHEVVDILGAKQLFWKVRVKPGSPTLAFIWEGTLVLCLSGNPFGAIANFELLGRPVLYALTGQEKWKLRTQQAKLQNDFIKPAGGRRFLRGWLEDGKVYLNGKNQASGAILAMADCNCLIEITPDMAGAKAGECVQVYML